MEKNEILIIYGGLSESLSPDNNIKEMTIRLVREAKLAEIIKDRGKRIGIKPNLVVARDASEGATTHPEIAAGVIEYLKKNGFDNLVILEGAWLGASTKEAFKACGFSKLAKDYGIELIDTKTDKTRMCNCKGMEIEICESALSVDFMINLPVMKGHCQTKLTCSLKNLKGVIPDREKRRFHNIGLYKPIAHLNTVVRNDFIIVDGICGDLDFEEGGTPVYSGRLIAARDPVLCDTWAAKQIGYEPHEIPYIGFAEKLGIGSTDISNAKVFELNTGYALPNDNKQSKTGKVKQFASYIADDMACSACYASLVYALFRLEKKALDRLVKKISVGQGFAGKKGSLGVGKCTADFTAYCPGCPPSGADIIAFLRRHIC